MLRESLLCERSRPTHIPPPRTQTEQENNVWTDMGKGSLGLYRQHDDPGKKWLAVRNLTGKVVLTVGIAPQMSFSAMDKASSVAFACRPVFGACIDAAAAAAERERVVRS